MKAILDEMLAALSRGERVVLSSILASSGSVPRGAGAKMAVFEDDRVLGTIGGGAVERLSIQRAQDAHKNGGSNEIKSYIVRTGMTMTEVVDYLSDEYGWSRSVPNLSGKLKRGSLRYGEAVELANALGYDIVWQKR